MADNRPEIVLDGNITPFRQKLREASVDLQRFGENSARDLQRLDTPLANLQSRFVAIGAVLSSLGFATGIRSALAQGDAIDEMADRTGIAVETLARLKFAGEQTGVSLDGMSTMVRKLSKLMVEAGSGDADAARKLSAFGASAEQIKRMDVEGVLKAIADRIRDLPEAARQGALEVLAKGFGDLVPLMKGGADGLQVFFDKADQLGVTSGFKAASAGAAELNDAVDRLSATGLGVLQRSMADMQPSLISAADGMSDLLLAAEKNKDSLQSLGVVVIGGALTAALKNMTARLAESTSSWLSDYQATRQAVAAKTAVAQSTLNSTAALRAHAAMLVTEAEAVVASTTGMARLAMVQERLIPARAQLVAVTKMEESAERALAAAKTEAAAKTNLGTMALNAMGGPLGAIVTLIGLGATAWAAFGDKGISAVRSVNDEIERGREVMARYQRELKFGAGDEGQLRASLDAIEKRISVLVQSSGASEAAAAELSRLRSEAEALQSALDGIENKGKPKGNSSSSLNDLLSGLNKPDKDKKDPSYMQYYEAALAERKRVASEEDALREYTKEEELAFWRVVQTYAQLSAADRIAVEKKVSDLVVTVRREEAKERQVLDRENADHAAAMAQLRLDAEVAAADVAMQLGRMDALERAQLDVQFEERRLALQRASLQERLRLADQDPNLSPAERARLLHQIEQLEVQHGTKIRQLQGKVTQESGRTWASFTDRMSSLWDKGVNALMNGTFRWSNAFRAIGAEMVRWFAVDIVGGMIKKWLAGKAEQLAISLGFFEKERVVELAASAQSVGIAQGEALAKIAATAPVAAAKAGESQAGIPIAGPMLALAAMAAIFAAVSGLSGKVKSASKGYVIPRGLNPMMQLHEEETVLPKEESATVRSLRDLPQMLAETQAALAAGGAGGGAQHVYHINAMDARSFRDFFRANAHAAAPGLQRLDRNFSLKRKS